MKATEKAIELINKFKEFADEEYHECSLQYDLNKARTKNAKACAVICVEQMLLMDVTGMILPLYYWNDVLKEIELI